MDSDRPPRPLDYLTQDAIQDLWGIGYTIVKRAGGDPFHVPPEMVPHTRSYQWWHLVHDKVHFHREGDFKSGWAAVPASRHDGYFMPFGHKGDIEVGGLGLFEKSKVEVEQELTSNAKAAHQQVADWVDKTGDLGISGQVKIGDVNIDVGAQADLIYQNAGTKSIDTTVKIPKDMVPHMAAIFEERDRLKAEAVGSDRILIPGQIADKFYAAVGADPGAPWWPTLHAILLPIAIENVRMKLTEEKSDE